MAAVAVAAEPASMRAQGTDAFTADMNSDMGASADFGFAEEDDEEVRQMQHNQRFQAAVLRSMEKQLGLMEEQIYDRDYELGNNERSREDLALWVGSMKKDVGRLETTKQAAVVKAIGLDNARKRAISEVQKLQKDLRAEKKINEGKTRLIENLNTQLTLKDEKLHERVELAKAWNEKVRMHRQLESNLDTMLVSKRKELQKAIEKSNGWRDKSESADIRVVEVESMKHAQEEQTIKAQRVVESLVRELDMLTAQADNQKQQLKEASKLMKKRDDLLFKINNKSNKMDDQLLAEKATNIGLTKENQFTSEQNDQLALSKLEMGQRLSDLTTRLQERDNTIEQKEYAMATLSFELKRTQTDLARLDQQHAELRKTYHAAQNDMGSMRANNQQLKAEYVHFKTEAETEIELSTKEAHVMKKQWNEGMKEAQMVLSKLQNDNMRFAKGNMECKLEFKTLTLNHEILDKEFGQLVDQYQRISQENSSLKNKMDAYLHKVNKYESHIKDSRKKNGELLRATEKKMMVEIQHLEEQIKFKKNELLSVSEAFVLAEQQLVKEREQHQDTSAAKRVIVGQLATESALHGRALREEHKKEENYKQSVVDLDLTRCELARVNRRNVKMQDQITALKKQVTETKLNGKERTAGTKYEIELLKAKLARAQGDSEKDRKLEYLRESELGRMQLERKVVYMTEKQQSVEKELVDSNKTRFRLERELRKAQHLHSTQERQYNVWQKEFESALTKGLKGRNERRGGSIRNVLMSATAPQTGDMMAQSMSSPRKMRGSATHRGEGHFVEELVHNLRSQLNRANSLGAERLNELVKVKHLLSDMRRAREKEKNKAASDNIDHHGWEKERLKLLEQMRFIQKKYLRLESLAASLEQQISETADYGYYPDLEPSLQLRAMIESDRVGGPGRRLGGGGARRRRHKTPIDAKG